jgi:spore germination cell wall hydrolase CwlJ-like protein
LINNNKPEDRQVIQPPIQMVSVVPKGGMVMYTKIPDVDLPIIDDIFQLDSIQDMEEKHTHEFHTYDSLGVTKDEFWNLVYIVYTESNLESDKGQQLVVHTIMNRVGDSRFADSIVGVIEQPSQFCGRWVDSWGEYTQANVDNVIRALANRIEGKASETELSVKFFHNHNVVASRGYANRFGLEQVVVEGNHTFLDYEGE